MRLTLLKRVEAADCVEVMGDDLEFFGQPSEGVPLSALRDFLAELGGVPLQRVAVHILPVR